MRVVASYSIKCCVKSVKNRYNHYALNVVIKV